MDLVEIIQKGKQKGEIMRRISLVLGFLFMLAIVPMAKANVYTVRIDASATNIPTSFSTASTSKVLAGVRSMVSILIDNRSATEVAVNCSAGPTTAPSDSTNNNIYVATLQRWAIDNANLSGTCYIRSMGSAITTGVVVITVTGY